MKNIALPKKIEFLPGELPNQKSVVIKPLFSGYGTTLGNSLRRVLLSSLPGAAVIGIKIKGAEHEFMALPNVKEDVLDIALKLKKLHVKLHTDEVVKLELEVHGEKEIKAGDIKKNSDIEIMNPELVLAHTTDVAGKLEMEIYVSKGFGYETIEIREERKKEIGYIEIDSIFSPVLAVGVSVENTRVGKMTNWDQLTLDITTDGVVTPEEAFNQSVEILIAQFNALINPVAEEETEEVEETEKEKTEEVEKEDKKKKDKKEESSKDKSKEE